ncbi:Zinc/iron permease [Lasiosphaeria hispida]|uniref:Zinc/iron permease n=1 Tax=Lasiosphaeria hispida TaxID=260671 RepID=A0AAJ0M8P1_9PEZI|nr:Zinc/iron permease [Lasiosphaeria hispida]
METPNSQASDLSWSSIPTHQLLAELSKRDDADNHPQCGSGKMGAYSTGLHVFALFLILAVSTLACGFPLFSRQMTKPGPRQRNFIFLCQHFGTGVLMATAFVHLLPTAFTSLTDPCLPYFFSKGYKPLAGLVAMASALVVVALESYLTTRGAGHSHSHIWSSDEEDSDYARVERQEGGDAQGMGSTKIPLQNLETQGLVAGSSHPEQLTPSISPDSGLSLLSRRRDSLDDLEEFLPEDLDGHRHTSEPGHGSLASPEERHRLLLQCLLLEAGILFHSVFIGMALSVATGPPFVVFLIAIAFHQCFEGLALGSRIAALHFPNSSPRPWLMVLAFGATTPIGQAIGLGIHQLYDPLSQTGLLMVGFMNAISSGLLLFAGLVQLLAEDFLSEKSYKTLNGKRRVSAFLAVLGGASLMSLVGAFA